MRSRLKSRLRQALRLALMPLGFVLIALIKIYQYVLSPMMPPTCRYLPTCSAYAAEAVQRHGALVGAWLAFRRIVRCHPWGGHGYDPVPKPHATRRSAITRGAMTSGDRA